MALTITGISSMATRRVLTELIEQYPGTGQTISIAAVGGVDAALRVRAGEPFDVIVLADNVVEALETEGHVVAGSRVAFVRSPMAMAVQAGRPRLDMGNEEAVRTALLGAHSIGYSTGPSGTHLLAVLKSWGLDPAAEPLRFVQAKPGIPVATLVAHGEAEIGIQQLSEFLGEPGIEILGVLPAPVQSVTTFSIGIGARSSHVEEARALLLYMNSAETAPIKRRLGMEPV